MLCSLFHSCEILFNSNILVFVFRYEGANQVQWQGAAILFPLSLVMYATI